MMSPLGGLIEGIGDDANWYEADVADFNFKAWTDNNDYSNDDFTFGDSCSTYNLVWDGDGRTTIDGNTFCSGVCQPCDVIVLPPGTTNDLLYIVDIQGSIGNPITIKNTAGLQTIIDTNDVIADPVYGNGLWVQRSKYIKIDGSNGYDESDENNLSYGIRITDSKYKGIFLNQNTSEIEIQYLEIDNAGIGIKESSMISNTALNENDTLAGLYIHHNYIRDTLGEGMYLGNTGGCVSYNCCDSKDDADSAVKWDNVRVYNNKTNNTGRDGISTGCCENTLVYNNRITEAGLSDFTGPGQGLGLSLNRGFGGSVYNNKIIGTQKEGIAWLGSLTATDIYNNVIADIGRTTVAVADNYRSGIQEIGPDSIHLTIRYNTFVNIPKKAIVLSTAQTGLIQDNLFVNTGDTNNYGATTITNPGVTKATVAECNFENPGNNNYNLTASTPADILDAGQVLGYPAFDLNGGARPFGSAPDIGAYEYGAIIPGPIPPIPTPDPTCSDLGTCCPAGQLCSGIGKNLPGCENVCCTGGTCIDPPASAVCQYKGYQCCNSCKLDPQPDYDSTCPGAQVCCVLCTYDGSSSTIHIDNENPVAISNFKELIENSLNWILGITGSLALLILIGGGVMYMGVNGDEQKITQAKRIILYAVIGLTIILLSYSIILVLGGILT